MTDKTDQLPPLPQGLRTEYERPKNRRNLLFKAMQAGAEIVFDPFMHRNFKMPMHEPDAVKEASCLHSDA
ncbi:hypothetical protein AL053_14210 [Pseudomonas savastanoi pv. fraxini]|uniref:hypothetical protein n=1 Tax=Pseudomonas savastanoi TaxID=29438 RepID=UPI0007602588|nr:hypothetical protein [Pseudomonas savastanoi]KWS80677.1 hypothetical protein AL053_14210 [Pseudomonas savastanoi pv. fraxini]